jgi:hypothetical protein
MSGVARLLADSCEVLECELDPLSFGCSYSIAGCTAPVDNTMRSPVPPPPTFSAPAPASFAIQKAQEAVRSFIQSQEQSSKLSTVVIPLGKSRANRRKGTPHRAASDEDNVPQKPEEMKKQKSTVGGAKKKAVSKCRKQGAKQGLSAAEAVREMARRMNARAKAKSNAPSSSRKSAAFYKSFPLVFGHNCISCTA